MVLKQQQSTNTGTCVAELPFIYLSTHDFFDLFGIPLLPLSLRYSQVEHLTSVNLLCWTLSVDGFYIEGIWILMLTHDFKEVWLIIVLDLVTTLGMILKKNKITNGNIQIFVPGLSFIYLCSCLDGFESPFIRLNNSFELFVYPNDFRDGFIVVILA